MVSLKTGSRFGLDTTVLLSIGLGSMVPWVGQYSIHRKVDQGVEIFADLWGFDASARDAAEPRGRARLKELVEGIEASGGEVAEAHFEVGNPEVRILAVAEELGAGLLVIGKTGYGGLRRALMGSISDYVDRHADAPVVIVGK